MPQLIYTPNNIKDPKNHPRRIFFSCHPDDASLFQTVEQDIRSMENDCVIARADYSVDTDADGDSYFQELADFHLTVIAVTSKWLSTENLSFDKEFPFLSGINKTVLPILFDSDAADDFKEKCPKIQYLRRSDVDYSEKLMRTLSSVLFSSKTVEMIKNVFPYSMFISYCREDRPYVTELISKIHSREAGRRVSVWFDKYLPMGKDFEESIFERVDDCSIFAVTLTPDIVGRSNYVEKKEYPHAKKKGKKIVFFEAESTPRDKLSVFDGHEKYPLIAYENDDQFSSELKRFLKSVPKSKPQTRLSNEETEYYLALAYLNGIFVEFDGAYAVDKLKKCVCDGYLPAAEQLVSAYAYGMGVERDTDKAISFSDVAVDIAKKRYEASLESYYYLYTNEGRRITSAFKDKVERVINALQNSTMEYVYQLGKAGSLLRDEGRIEGACQRFQTAVEALRHVNSLSEHLHFGESLIVRYENELMRTRHTYRLQGAEDAKGVYERSLAAYNESPDNPFCINAMISNAQMYAMELLQGDEPQSALAQEILRGAIEIAERNISDKDVYELLLLLCRDMARCLMVKEDYEGARKYLANGIRLYEKLPAESAGNIYLQLYLPQAMYFCGETYFNEENYEGSVKWHTYAFYATLSCEEKLGERASQADLPISLLQTYAIIIDRLAAYVHKDDSDLVQKMLDVIHRYTKMTRYSKEQMAQAQVYMDMLESSRALLLS